MDDGRVAALCSEKDGSLHRRFLIFPMVFPGCVLCPDPHHLRKKLRNVTDSWSIKVGFSFTSQRPQFRREAPVNRLS